MSEENYNPENDEFLNKLKKIKKKEKQLVKYNEAIENASKDVPLSKIKEQAKEYSKSRKKRFYIILISVLIVLSLITCIFICLIYESRKDLPLSEAPLPKFKMMDINVVYFSKTDFNADINKRLTNYLDSLKTADSIDIFKLHIINSGDTMTSDNVNEIVIKLSQKQFEAQDYKHAGKLLNNASNMDNDDLIIIGVLPKYDKNLFKDKFLVDFESINQINTILVYHEKRTNKYQNFLIKAFKHVKKITQ